MKKNLFLHFMLVLIACMLMVLVSCSEKYPKKYEMTSQTIEELIDYVIKTENLSESDIALYGGRDGIKDLVISELGGKIMTFTLVDENNIRAVMGSDVIETTYEISGSDIIILQTNNTGNKKLLGTLSKDKKTLAFNPDIFGMTITLYLSE